MIRAETMFAFAVAEHNLPFSSKDEVPCLNLNVEIFWSKMSDLNLAFGSSKRFPNLCNLAKACLVLHVSNAEVEYFHC